MISNDKRTDIQKQDDLLIDDALPGLAFLDPEFTRVEIANRLPRDPAVQLEDCRVRYIRYKPCTNCIIAYSAAALVDGEKSRIDFYAKIHTPCDFDDAAAKSENHRWVDVAVFGPVMAFPESRTIFYFFPNDCAIEGLRALSDTKKIQRILYEHYDKYPEEQWRISDRKMRIDLVRFKPERRVVLRCDTKAVNRDNEKRRRLSVFLRIYPDERGERIFSLQNNIFEAARKTAVFSVARPVACLPERSMLIMEALPGEQFLDALTDSGESAMVKAAAAIGTLQNMPVAAPERDARSYISEAAATKEMLAHLMPELQDKCEAIFEFLESNFPASRNNRLIHGDFYHGQLLVDEQGVSILDFDRSALGDPLSDIGNFCAHLRLLYLKGRLENRLDMESKFLSSYEETVGKRTEPEALRFWIAFGLFQLAVDPFRRFESGWRKKAGDIISECGRILDL